MKAVIFDLFETLVDYDDMRSRAFTHAAADLLGRDRDEFHSLWRDGRPARDSGPLATYIATLDLDDDLAERLVALRRETGRAVLMAPRHGVVDTLRELRRRALKTGLITICSEDVVDVWPDTPFAGLFDVEVFSCAVGMLKPDPRIYELACERLGVAPREAVFVGDGANDELAGAERVGMRAVMIGDGVQGWSGARIATIPEILELT
jgi:putative hydrolase of the HAD superfamily